VTIADAAAFNGGRCRLKPLQVPFDRAVLAREANGLRVA
jgi:hypothetical protein